jgi:hypothetical protein
MSEPTAELTEAGFDAMAAELYRLATDQGWDRATTELRQEFRGFVRSMVDKAYEAERESREQDAPRRVLL